MKFDRNNRSKSAHIQIAGRLVLKNEEYSLDINKMLAKLKAPSNKASIFNISLTTSKKC